MGITKSQVDSVTGWARSVEAISSFLANSKTRQKFDVINDWCYSRATPVMQLLFNAKDPEGFYSAMGRLQALFISIDQIDPMHRFFMIGFEAEVAVLAKKLSELEDYKKRYTKAAKKSDADYAVFLQFYLNEVNESRNAESKTPMFSNKLQKQRVIQRQLSGISCMGEQRKKGRKARDLSKTVVRGSSR